MKRIAVIHTDFPEKFGVPRQSGLVPGLMGEIVFEKEYAVWEAFRGLEDYSHIWLLWEFNKIDKTDWSPTVRPPRLGGEKRMGVFATRSPFRPNSIGLSVVKLEKIENRPGVGPVITVSGVDLVDGTPIYDIKPYLPHVDAIEGARGGFSEKVKDYALEVKISPELLLEIPEDKREALIKVLSEDPRPSYQDDPTRVYGMNFSVYNVKFMVNSGVLVVTNIEKINNT